VQGTAPRSCNTERWVGCIGEQRSKHVEVWIPTPGLKPLAQVDSTRPPEGGFTPASDPIRSHLRPLCHLNHTTAV
jgi:hypothetical protein